MQVTVGDAADLLGLSPEQVMARPELIRTLSDPQELRRLVESAGGGEREFSADDERIGEDIFARYAAMTGVPYVESPR